MQLVLDYIRCKWLFLLLAAILLALNYYAWSWLWEEPDDTPRTSPATRTSFVSNKHTPDAGLFFPFRKDIF